MRDISHNDLDRRDIHFRIDIDASATQHTYRVFTATRTTIAPPTEGTGLRYIRSRLAESYPGRWSLTYGPVPGGWETVIRVGF